MSVVVARREQILKSTIFQSLLDTSRRNEIRHVVDVDLSSGEDSVTSLAIARSTDTSVTVVAGINSSQAAQNDGVNEHCRTLLIQREAGGKTEAIGKRSFFKPSSATKKESYQRITRIARRKENAGEPQVAAIASGLAPEGEIVIFNPETSEELARINLKEKEAADLDISLGEDGISGYLLAFCTDSAAFVQQISNKKAGLTDEPAMIYEAPLADSGTVRPKNKLLRFIYGGRHVLLVQNQAAGTELLVIKLSASEGISGDVILQKRLSTVSKAVSLAVCPLSKSAAGDYQTVIAVAGNAGSIELLSLNYSPSKGLSRFLPFVALKAVHSAPTTALAFSNFVEPAMPVTGEAKPQSLRLASTSAGGDIVIHTLPLQPYPAKSKNPSYVLASPGKSDVAQAVFSVSMAAVVIAIVAFLLQAFSEIRGAVPPTLGAADWLSPQLKQLIHRPYTVGNNPITSSDVPVVATVKQKLHEIVAEHASAETPKAIVVRDEGNGELSTEVRHDTEIVHEETLRKWEDLHEHEKEGWKQKLSDAGHWTASQGDNVLEGILFSELAGVVGEMVGGA
jgi:hypothetical protein